MPTLQELKQQDARYLDIPDAEFAFRIWDKNYKSRMPMGVFADRTGLNNQQFSGMVDYARSAGYEPTGESYATGYTPPVEKQKARAFAQGATLGFAEEVEAAVRSFVPGGPEYSDIRNELRQKLTDYKTAYPAEAISLEIAGALVPALITRGRSAPFSLARASAVGGSEGLIAGIGYGEGGAQQQASGAGVSSLVGMVANPAIEGLMNLAGVAGRNLINFAREKFGGRTPDIIQNELDRLVKETGLTVDEVVDGVANGSIMAENRTLTDTVRAYRTSGGGAQSFINQQTTQRARDTYQNAMDVLQENLAPGQQKNVLKLWNSTDASLRAAENKAYDSVFDNVPDVTADIGNYVENVLRRFPDARVELEKLYSEENLVPLFRVNDFNELVLLRAPSLRDAEILRRQLDENATALFRSGGGQRGSVASEAEKGLRGLLDDTYPSLKDTRAAAASTRAQRDAFNDGLRILNKSKDEVEIIFEQYKGNADALQALRYGFMSNIRKQAGTTRPALIRGLNDPETQRGAAFNILFPENQAAEALRLISIADDAQFLNAAKSGSGSATQPTAAAAERIGEVAVDAATGNALGVAGKLANLIIGERPELSNSQVELISRILFSTDPDFVRRALTDDSFLTQVGVKIDPIIRSISNAGRGGLLQQVSQFTSPMAGQMAPSPTGQ